MSDIVIRGHYADHQFIPQDPLPNIEGEASLVIHPETAKTGSMFELFGKAAVLRTEEEISREIAKDRMEWDEP